MSDSCLTCGGLIPEPNTSYGYAGKICHCIKQPAFCRPVSMEVKTNYLQDLRDNAHLVAVDEKEFQRMKAEISQLQAANTQLTSALEFYASLGNDDSYDLERILSEAYDIRPNDKATINLGGKMVAKLARATLEKIKGSR